MLASVFQKANLYQIWVGTETHLCPPLHTHTHTHTHGHVLESSVCVHDQLCLTLSPHRLYPARLLNPWDFSGKNTGIGCHALFQGIFLIQNQTFISCIAGRFFATEPPEKPSCYTFSSALELCPLKWVGNETNTLWKSQPCPFLTRILPKQVKCGRTSYLDLPMPVNDQSNTIRSRLSARICDFSGPPRWHYW